MHLRAIYCPDCGVKTGPRKDGDVCACGCVSSGLRKCTTCKTRRPYPDVIGGFLFCRECVGYWLRQWTGGDAR